jgi:hypothetical protein
VQIDSGERGGYIKLVIVSQPECFVMLAGLPGKRWIQIVAGPDPANQVTAKGPVGSQGEVVTLTLRAVGDRVEALVEDQTVLETARPPHGAGHAAIAVSGWRCNFDQAEVILPNVRRATSP